MEFTLWPLESVDAGPPTDVVFAFPKFRSGFPTLVNRLSFDIPPIGELVWSIGYTGFKWPDGGIPIDAVRNGTFDWHNSYGHRLVVVEGTVQRIFTQRFARGYLEGACFSFDAEIHHAQSGGPVISLDGIVRGVNSAGATQFFDHPASLASLLHPFLFSTLRFGVQMGPVRINATHRLIDLIAQGTISTDGSEENVSISQDHNTGHPAVNPRAAVAMSDYIHDDFKSFQQSRKATTKTGTIYRIRIKENEQGP